jgi:ATP-dependent RNA helicase DDX1
MPEIIKAIQELGWNLPRDVQAECIPLILGGGDLMAVIKYKNITLHPGC